MYGIDYSTSYALPSRARHPAQAAQAAAGDSSTREHPRRDSSGGIAERQASPPPPPRSCRCRKAEHARASSTFVLHGRLSLLANRPPRSHSPDDRRAADLGGWPSASSRAMPATNCTDSHCSCSGEAMRPLCTRPTSARRRHRQRVDEEYRWNPSRRRRAAAPMCRRVPAACRRRDVGDGRRRGAPRTPPSRRRLEQVRRRREPRAFAAGAPAEQRSHALLGQLGRGDEFVDAVLQPRAAALAAGASPASQRRGRTFPLAHSSR